MNRTDLVELRLFAEWAELGVDCWAGVGDQVLGLQWERNKLTLALQWEQSGIVKSPDSWGKKGSVGQRGCCLHSSGSSGCRPRTRCKPSHRRALGTWRCKMISWFELHEIGGSALLIHMSDPCACYPDIRGDWFQIEVNKRFIGMQGRHNSCSTKYSFEPLSINSHFTSLLFHRFFKRSWE